MGVKAPAVVKRRAKAGEKPEYIPVEQSVHTIADIIFQKVREDLKADKKGKTRPTFDKFLRQHMLRTYGLKKSADKADRDLR